MKPQRILLFLCIVGIVASGIAMLFPADGINIAENITLSFHYNPFLHEHADSVTATVPTLAEPAVHEDTATKAIDSTSTTKTATNAVPTAVPSDSHDKHVPKEPSRKIEFATTDTIRFKNLKQRLDNCGKRQVRILHYGDSQIEGDRITGYLRNLMQKKYGGSGPGLLPAMPPIAKTSAIVHTASSNWTVHSSYSKADTSLHHNKFGIMGCFSQFKPTSAWIEFAPSGQAYKSVQDFTQCKVFYSHPDGDFTVKGFVDSELKWFEDFEPTSDTKQFQWIFEQSPKHFRIEFEGVKSPSIYAISLDSPTGVTVDNLPFRGSKGTEFVKLDMAQMKQMGRYLPVGLIIYEFGVNAVANNSRNYGYYERNLRKQLQYLKKIWPQATILVVSSSDMSEKSGNGYATRPSVAKVIEAQRNAAFAESCAFWNLYEAMGGYNSMPQWVNSHLAQKDYTHFNREGGHRVAQMLYDAIMSELEHSK